MAAEFLHFRNTPELDRRLDAEVARLRKQGISPRVANKSSIARAVLLDALGSPRAQAAADEVMARVYGVSRAVTEKALQRVMAAVPAILAEELRTID